MEIPEKEDVLTPAEVRRIPRRILSSTAKLLYEQLYLFWQQGKDWKGSCTAGGGVLANSLGLDSPREIYRVLVPSLVRAGLIQVEKVHGYRSVYYAVDKR